MTSHSPRVLREYGTHQFFAMTPPPKRRLLCTTVSGKYMFRVYSDQFNLVLQRDLRENTRLAVQTAVHLALRYPEQKVLLLNTYAGYELMYESFAAAMDEYELQHGTIIPNLTVLDVPLTQWKQDVLRELVVTKQHSIIVWNSFEFAGVTRYQREKIATEAMVLQEAHPVTHIVFSHEANRKQQAGQPGRGALGMLAAAAGSLWNLSGEPEDDEERTFWLKAISFKQSAETTPWSLTEEQRTAMESVDLESLSEEEAARLAAGEGQSVERSEAEEDELAMSRLGEKAKEVLGGEEGVRVIQGASLLLQLLMRDIHEKEMQKRARRVKAVWR